MTTVLLLEDDPFLRNELLAVLGRNGCRVLIASHERDIEPLLDTFDIAIVDANIGSGDGMRVAARVRAARPGCGVMILTVQTGLKRNLASMRKHADFVLVKPISLEELQAHLIMLGRRVRSYWQLHRTQRQLISPSGHATYLNEQEMMLLTLAAQHGEIVTRREIAHAMRIDWLEFDNRRLDQTISRLRRRWLKNSGRVLPLLTQHGKGFFFGAEIVLV
ncbi:response regulator [uncultured Oxalicibacterium sp.]|uniref:response regulator transcription factor n=1 Tax=uncultured Oxalicibacterium sp. TaxID=1168540 RepID=UPI0025E4FE16|nr:response regulator [uncultured Oxalicibacterium sp.]